MPQKLVSCSMNINIIIPNIIKIRLDIFLLRKLFSKNNIQNNIKAIDTPTLYLNTNAQPKSTPKFISFSMFNLFVFIKQQDKAIIKKDVDKFSAEVLACKSGKNQKRKINIK